MAALVLNVASLRDVEKAANDFFEFLKERGGKKVAFEGEMGAGKTTFIKAVLKVMGVDEPTASPTFSIVNEYVSPHYGSIFHFDFYRLNKPEEAYDIGVEEIFEQDAWSFMEWPGKVGNLLPADCVWVRITEEKGSRLIEVML